MSVTQEPIETLVARLQKANYAYHNGGELVLGDDEYDRQLEELRKRCPTHPFLTVIGAPAKGGVLLPYTMASLDKVRYGEGGLTRWQKKAYAKNLVIMEKLDGLSALYVCNAKGKSMYLRGDGVKGVNVSRVCGSLGMLPVPSIIRGEILLPNDKTPEGSIGRSLVNGWLHRAIGSSEPIAKNVGEVTPSRLRTLDTSVEVPIDLKSCHFVAYQVLEPAGMTRSEQIQWLKTLGFKVPQTCVVESLTEEKAKEILVSWKTSSRYPLDGIVVGFDCKPFSSPGGEVKNPEDAVAFKASLDEQKAETEVVNVEWNLSRQSIYVPRIQIKPVVIGGARIEWLSGHNAALISANGVGPGAKIVIRRSGDVIPTLDTVLEKVSPQMPPEGSWTWDSNSVQAVKKQDDSNEYEEGEKSIQHCLTTLGVEGIGPGLVKKLVEGGYDSMKKIYSADASSLVKVIGQARGTSLAKDLREKVSEASQIQLLIASNLLPRGVGERKLRPLYSLESDAKGWTSKLQTPPAGWSDTTLEELFKALPKAFQWIESTFGDVWKTSKTALPVQEEVVGEVKYVVFTGCRLSGPLPAGWVMEDSVTKKTNLLVVADSAIEKETTKTKKAKELGVPIRSLSDFTTGL